MKLTSNFIIYLNADNKVRCAKCRATGRFVKRTIAQSEYLKEYGFFNMSLLTMLFVLLLLAFNNVQNVIGFKFVNLLYKTIVNNFKGVYNSLNLNGSIEKKL